MGFKFNPFTQNFDIVGAVIWGDISGTLSDQADLQNALDAKSDVGHTHVAIDITDFDIEVGNHPDVSANTSDRHTQNTDTILTTDGSIALLNAGILKINLLSDDAVNIQIDEIRARDGDGLKLFDDAGNGIFIKDGGIVGIGITTPDSLLHVYKESAGSVSSLPGTTVTIEGDSTNYLSFLGWDSGEQGIIFGQASNNQSGGIYYSSVSNDTMDFRTSANNTRMVILAGGNIGIGTTTPDALLDVEKVAVGSAAILRVHHGDGTNQSNHAILHLQTEAAFGGDPYIRFTVGGQPSTGDWSIGIDNSNTDAFKISNSTTLGTATRLKIDYLGNVGINNNSPTEKLDVIGNIKLSDSLTDGTNAVTPAELRTHLDDVTTNPHDITAALISADTTNFDGALSVADDTVQKALDTLDNKIQSLHNAVTISFQPDQSHDFGDYRVHNISAAGNSNFTFKIPDDFLSLIELHVHYIPAANIAGGKTIDLNSDYASNGELSNNHSESLMAQSITGTANTIEELDIAGIFTNISAGDFCGFNWKNNTIGTTISILIIEMIYNQIG